MCATTTQSPPKVTAERLRGETICPGIAWANVVVFHWRLSMDCRWTATRRGKMCLDQREPGFGPAAVSLAC
jgi:hypothetical protein